MVFSIIVGDREGKGTDQLTPLVRKALERLCLGNYLGILARTRKPLVVPEMWEVSPESVTCWHN